MKKRVKGQLSLFIIVGVVLLILLLIFIYYQRQGGHAAPETIIPSEVAPVHAYVQSCMRDVAENAVQLMGTQGGYIEIPPEISRRPQSYIPLDPQGYFKSPLWFYRGNSQVPNLNVVAEQMNGFVEKNLLYCLNNFTVFGQNYAVTNRTFLLRQQCLCTLKQCLVIVRAQTWNCSQYTCLCE